MRVATKHFPKRGARFFDEVRAKPETHAMEGGA